VTQSWYHIVVIGMELSGLIYAALAAKMGYRVLVIGQGERPNTYKQSGFWFLRQPERLLGFGTSPIVARAFGDLSLHLEMKNRPQPVDILQMTTPSMRLELGGARRLWEREVEREIPGALAAFDRFDARMQSLTEASNAFIGLTDGVIAKGAEVEPSDRLASLLPEPRAQIAVEAPLTHLSGLLAEPLPTWVMARLWTHLRAGIHRFPGGTDGLKHVFVRKIRDQASDVRAEAYATRVVMKRGKIVAVELAERGESVGCELVVGNVDPKKIANLVSPEDRQDAWHARLAALEPCGWRMQVNVGLDPRVLPRGMGPELLWVIDPRARARGDNCVWISRPGVGPHAGGDARPGPGVIQLSAILEARTGTPTLQSVQRLSSAMVGSLRALVPWLDEHLKAVDVPALQTVGGEPTLELDALTPAYRQALPETLGASAFGAETPYRNLLLAGEQRFAGLGFEGTCITALQALHLTRERVKLHRGLRGERILG
jgi:hypothetical protein